MSVQLELFSKPDQNYKVVRYFGRMIDTNGCEIYFVQTIKAGLTKCLAEKFLQEQRTKIHSDDREFFDLVEETFDN